TIRKRLSCLSCGVHHLCCQEQRCRDPVVAPPQPLSYSRIRLYHTKKDVFVRQAAIKRNNPRKYLLSVYYGETMEYDDGERGAGGALNTQKIVTIIGALHATGSSMQVPAGWPDCKFLESCPRPGTNVPILLQVTIPTSLRAVILWARPEHPSLLCREKVCVWVIDHHLAGILLPKGNPERKARKKIRKTKEIDSRSLVPCNFIYCPRCPENAKPQDRQKRPICQLRIPLLLRWSSAWLSKCQFITPMVIQFSLPARRNEFETPARRNEQKIGAEDFRWCHPTNEDLELMTHQQVARGPGDNLPQLEAVPGHQKRDCLCLTLRERQPNHRPGWEDKLDHQLPLTMKIQVQEKMFSKDAPEAPGPQASPLPAAGGSHRVGADPVEPQGYMSWGGAVGEPLHLLLSLLASASRPPGGSLVVSGKMLTSHFHFLQATFTACKQCSGVKGWSPKAGVMNKGVGDIHNCKGVCPVLTLLDPGVHVCFLLMPPSTFCTNTASLVDIETWEESKATGGSHRGDASEHGLWVHMPDGGHLEYGVTMNKWTHLNLDTEAIRAASHRDGAAVAENSYGGKAMREHKNEP
ncbi:hypothetical protein J0S82_008720, partial [Galemys pyrenaicus]